MLSLSEIKCEIVDYTQPELKNNDARCVASSENSISTIESDFNPPSIKYEHCLEVKVEEDMRCDACGETFTALSDFKSHLRLHTTLSEDITSSPMVQFHTHRADDTPSSPVVQFHTHQAHYTPSSPMVQLHTHGTDDTPSSPMVQFHTHPSMLSVFKSHLRLNTTKAEDNKSSPIVQFPSHGGDHDLIIAEDMRCDVCGEIFYVLSDFKSHLRLHTKLAEDKTSSPNGQFNPNRADDDLTIAEDMRCDACGEIFSVLSDFKSHLRLHTTLAEDKTSSPMVQFDPHRADDPLSSLEEPLHLHHGPEANESPLNPVVHFRVHKNPTDDNPSSPVDPLCINAPPAVKDLLSPAILPATKQFNCDQCDKAFSRADYLRRHTVVHTGETPFKCDICAKSFSHVWNLRQHFTTHTGEKPFKCESCGKSFSQLSHLKAHAPVHTGEKPFECKFCGKWFARQDYLKLHKKMHTGEKRYNCDSCNKCFSRPDHLKAHKAIHTGVKPYQCSMCNKSFAQHSNLRQHAVVHTGEKRFTCDLCGKLFSQVQNLKTHRKRVHSQTRKIKVPKRIRVRKVVAANGIVNKKTTDETEQKSLVAQPPHLDGIRWIDVSPNPKST